MGREKIKIDLLIHDLKGPLAVIENNVRLLTCRQVQFGPLTPQQEKMLNRIKRSTQSLIRQVNDALELSRGATPEGIQYSSSKIGDLISITLGEVFELTDGELSDKIRSGVSFTELQNILSTKNFHLEMDSVLWESVFLLDCRKVSQILRNLLINALKYRKSLVGLALTLDDKALCFTVSDDGAGIPHHYHKKIFEAYFQLDSQDIRLIRGHGLGLAGALVLTEDLGGQLLLESDKGQGASFHVFLPL